MVLGTKIQMSNRFMWEKQGRKNACRLCGQFIDNGEDYYLVVVPYPFYKSQHNFIVHAHEWEAFCGGDESVAFLIGRLAVVDKPKTKNHTAPDNRKVEAFKRVLSANGYRITNETSNRIYFKMSNGTAQFHFEKRFGFLEYSGRTSGLFDRMVMHEITARLNEQWQKELGNDVEEGFRVEKVFEKASKIAHNLFGDDDE